MACGALDRIFGPGGKFAGEVAFDRPEIGHIRADIEQLNTVNLSASTTELAVGKRRKAHIGLAKITETLARGWRGIEGTEAGRCLGSGRLGTVTGGNGTAAAEQQRDQSQKSGGPSAAFEIWLVFHAATNGRGWLNPA